MNDLHFTVYVILLAILTMGIFVNLAFLAKNMGDSNKIADNLYNLVFGFVYLVAWFYLLAKFYLFLRGGQ